MNNIYGMEKNELKCRIFDVEYEYHSVPTYLYGVFVFNISGPYISGI